MIMGIPKEILRDEARVAALPETVAEYRAMGFRVLVESSAGAGALRSDDEYRQAGGEIVRDALDIYAQSDLVLKVKQPWFHQGAARHEAELICESAMLIAFLHPAAPANHTTIEILRRRGITALTMDSIPRISRAQPMDALTSMSTISGYKAVLIAANRLPRFVPMIGTPFGTLKAAKVLVVGAGVVGLQAIATAKRLGGAVQAVDIRDEARRAAESLGVKVIGFEVPEALAVGEGGYAKALPDDWLQKERDALAPWIAEADIVVLSALVPGEVAPILVTRDMLGCMKPGAVIVDVSVDQGGNCEVTEPGEERTFASVLVCGTWNIPGAMPVHASWLYAHNVLRFVQNLFKRGLDAPDFDDEIVRSSLVTRSGKIVHAGTLKAIQRSGKPDGRGAI
jgi:NAD(P) transhydrogenase subunit alpha